MEGEASLSGSKGHSGEPYFLVYHIKALIFCCCDIANEDIAPSRMSGPVPYFLVAPQAER